MELSKTPESSQDERNVSHNLSDTSSVPSKRIRLSRSRMQKKQLTTETDPDDLLRMIRSKIENQNDTSDRFDYIAKNWAEKLRNLDLKQKIFAEKLVNDILFEAELQRLSCNSTISINCPKVLPSYSSFSSPSDSRNIYSSLAPGPSTQSFNNSGDKSNQSEQSFQEQITDNNFVTITDSILNSNV